MMSESGFYDPATWAPQPELDRMLADKEIDGEEAETVKAFAEFLTKASLKDNTAGTNPPTPEQIEWTRNALRDSQWREFIGLPPLPDAPGGQK